MHAWRFIIQIIDHFQKQGGGFLPKSGSQKSKKLLTTYTTPLFQDSPNPISTQLLPTQTPLTTFFDKPPLSNHPPHTSKNTPHPNPTPLHHLHKINKYPTPKIPPTSPLLFTKSTLIYSNPPQSHNFYVLFFDTI